MPFERKPTMRYLPIVAAAVAIGAQRALPLDAELGGLVGADLDDQRLDEHLRTPDVELLHQRAAAIDPDGAHDAVINLQGDMPFADPGLATACAALLHGGEVAAAARAVVP